MRASQPDDAGSCRQLRRADAGEAAGSVPAANASSDAEVADFLAKVKALDAVAGGERGRLVFAMDATMSREPTWDMALGCRARCSTR